MAENAMSHTHARGISARAKTHQSYLRLGAMTVFSFLAMYALMYAMVDRVSNVFMNWNQGYMAALMTAPMVLIELGLMRSMYPVKRLNTFLSILTVLALVLSWFAIRRQAEIGDEQFLRSMIPHHAGAILMCPQASLRDPEILQLCQGIVASQQREIDFMKLWLRRGRASG